jgi:hypothetical protein
MGPLARTRTGRPFPGLALLRVGFAEPPGSPRALVRSYRTVSPSPVPRRAIGGLFSVALSCGSPRLAAGQHPALWSPDLPRRRQATPRPPGRLTVTSSVPEPAGLRVLASVWSAWPVSAHRSPGDSPGGGAIAASRSEVEGGEVLVPARGPGHGVVPAVAVEGTLGLVAPPG